MQRRFMEHPHRTCLSDMFTAMPWHETSVARRLTWVVDIQLEGESMTSHIKMLTSQSSKPPEIFNRFLLCFRVP